jgi:hypothetical protein
LQGEALARVGGANNSAQRTLRDNQSDAERETRLTNSNASRRQLRKRRTDDVEVVTVTACAGLVENTSLSSKRRTLHRRGLAVVNENDDEQTFETLALENDARVSSWRTLRCTSCSAGVYSDVRPR